MLVAITCGPKASEWVGERREEKRESTTTIQVLLQ